MQTKPMYPPPNRSAVAEYHHQQRFQPVFGLSYDQNGRRVRHTKRILYKHPAR